jgi:hypothetical protein
MHHDHQAGVCDLTYGVTAPVSCGISLRVIAANDLSGPHNSERVAVGRRVGDQLIAKLVAGANPAQAQM